MPQHPRSLAGPAGVEAAKFADVAAQWRGLLATVSGRTTAASAAARVAIGHGRLVLASFVAEHRLAPGARHQVEHRRAHEADGRLPAIVAACQSIAVIDGARGGENAAVRTLVIVERHNQVGVKGQTGNGMHRNARGASTVSPCNLRAQVTLPSRDPVCR